MLNCLRRADHCGGVTKSLLLLGMVMSVQCAHAQEHLLPKRSSGSFLEQDYDRIVRSVLKDAFQDDVIVKAQIWNPLGSESIVGVRQTGPEFHLFFLESTDRLFSYAEIDNEKHNGATPEDIAGWQNSLGPLRAKVEDVPVSRCDRRIDQALARKIVSAWDRMVADTQTPTRVPQANDSPGLLVVDGTSYEFFNQSGQVGTAYGPDAKGPVAALIAVADAIRQVCSGELDQRRERLNSRLDAILKW